MFDQPVGWQKSESRWCYGATILLYDGRFDKHSLGRNRSNSGRDDEIFQITQSLPDNISLWQAIHNLSQAIHKQYRSMIPREIAFLLHLRPGLVWEANCTLSSLTGERERESLHLSSLSGREIDGYLQVWVILVQVEPQVCSILDSCFGTILDTFAIWV